MTAYEPVRSLPGVVYPTPARLREYVSKGCLELKTLNTAFRETMHHFAQRTAIRALDSGRTYTYSQLDELSEQFGAGLLARGLQPGDRVIVQIGNTEELFFALHGCFKAGLIPIATLPTHREHEIAFLAAQAEARAHLVQVDLRNGELVNVARAAADVCPSMKVLVGIRGIAGVSGSITWEELLDGMGPAEARRMLRDIKVGPLDVAILQLSGGTTGTPKMIPRFHAEYLLNMRLWAERSHYDENTVVFWPLPIIHNAGLVCGPGPVHLYGGHVVLQQSLEPRALLSALQRERVTLTAAPIPIIVRLQDSGLLPQHDLSSITDFITAGETALVERDLRVPGYHLFGMSEGLCMRTTQADPLQARHDTVGCPLSPCDEVRLLEPGTEQEVPLGSIGELCCRGPYTLHGYYKAEEHNRRAFTSDGFYRSGDLMKAHRIGAATYYSFEGRIKDNIDRGGEKINAEELERLIVEHSSVREVAVIGVPDREFGERVCACLILESDCGPVSVEELRAFLLALGLAKFKCPERIEIVDNFPVTQVGKVSKPALRETIIGRMRRTTSSGSE